MTNINELWIDPADAPEEDGLCLVTFLATWKDCNDAPHSFRGIDIVECLVDENKVTWVTNKIKDRFSEDTKVEILAWMYTPEAFE